MRCTACDHENPDADRFCGQCGAGLTAPTRAGQAIPTFVGGGRYRSLRLLGEGARKRVYLATDERLGREVAVAVVKTDGLDAGGRLRISREAQAMARLGDDPHVVTVYDVGEETDGTPYIVSQFMPGGSLADHLAEAPDGRLEVARALELGEHIASGLAHAHHLGIVHRDLKPANVWLGADGRARLGDFGLAANLGASRITTEGMLLGTVAYLAPEQALGQDPDPRADLYALGALLYELLCGRPPFLGDDAVSVIGQHLNTVPVAPRFHNEAVPQVVESLILQLLAKDPAARPASAAEVARALRDTAARQPDDATAAAAAAPVTRSAIASLADWGRFVGRDDELQALRTAFEDILSGRTRTVMVVGEPGIGKTRMVEEFSVHASLRGARVLWGHSYEGEGGVPFLPFAEALRSLVRDADGLALDPGAGCAELATIVPELRERLPELPVLPPLDGDAERHRLFEGVSAFLEAVTPLRPVVLVLDDLHWADKPSLLLLAHLARRVRRSRLMVVGTYRDVELERSHPLAEVIGTLRRERLYERVLLRGLPLDEVKHYIEAIGGQETPGAFAELIFRETEGNPFFVAEILRHLVESGALRHEGGVWVGTPESVAQNLPEGVREVIGRRLDALSPGCNAALAVAAAMPGGFTIDVVGDVVGVDEDTMLDYLDEALGAQVVRERRERPGTYEFNHALIRQTLYGELSTPRRVRMHRKVTDALERRFADSVEVHLPELAYHAFQAAPGGDVGKAVEYARRAGDHAMARVAYEEAARHFDMALQSLDLDNDTDWTVRVDLLLALARAQDRAGDDDASHEAASAAADLARVHGDSWRLARAALAYVGSSPFETARADLRRVRLLDEAARAMRTEAPSPAQAKTLASVLTAHARTIAFRDQETFTTLIAEARVAAAASGDPGTRAAIIQASGLRLVLDDEEAQLELREVIELAELAGDSALSQSTHASMVIHALSYQDHDDLQQHVEAYAASAEISREPRQRAVSLMLQGVLASIEGRYEDAEQLLRASASLSRAIGDVNNFASVGIALAPVRRELGTLGALEQQTRAVVEANPTTYGWRAGFAQLLAEAGKTDEAIEHVREILLGTLPTDASRPYTIAMLIEVAAAAGDAVALTSLDNMREDFVNDRGVIIGANAYHGSRARFRGLLDAALGRFGAAVAAHERALAVHDSFRASGWAARSRFDLALALLARDQQGDVSRAAGELNRAVEQASTLGMKRLLDQALTAKLQLQGISSGSVTASIDAVSAHVSLVRPRIGQQAGEDGQVTICFSDIVGYTSMTDRLGDARTHQVLRTHNELLRGTLTAHEGIEVKSEGDGFMLAFREPRQALRFAQQFRQRLAAEAWGADVGDVLVRMGIHCGQVIRDSDDFFGRTVIIGARIASSAGAGEVLATAEVRAAAGSEFRFGEERELTLKGLRQPHIASLLVH